MNLLGYNVLSNVLRINLSVLKFRQIGTHPRCLYCSIFIFPDSGRHLIIYLETNSRNLMHLPLLKFSLLNSLLQTNPFISPNVFSEFTNLLHLLVLETHTFKHLIPINNNHLAVALFRTLQDLVESESCLPGHHPQWSKDSILEY